MSRRRRQELYCHNCDHHVQFVVDMELDGNHVLNCPNCQHEHCRVVRDGRITEDRWDQRNGGGTGATTAPFTYYISAASTAFSVNRTTTASSGLMFVANHFGTITT